MKKSSPLSADSSNPSPALAVAFSAATAAAVVLVPAPVAVLAPAPTSVAASQGILTVGPVSAVAAPTTRRYHTRVGPIPPSPPHPRPSQRASPSKRARTSGLGDSSSSRPLEPQSPPTQGPIGDLPSNLSPASIIRGPYFHYNPIPGNANCSERDLHSEIYYDLPAFVEDPEFRDSMRLVHRYSLEPFMTPCQFFYPRVVIEFYHTMTSRREPNPTTIHFTLPVVLANSTDYR